VRDVFQYISIFIGALILLSVWLRTKRTTERARDWLPIIIISLMLIVFYLAVFIDQKIDFMSASDVSSAIRLISEVLILIFVRYFPYRIKL
jgi:glucan phosphoethanolaminetransferase (alkaline phosphatase superfamily)